MSAGAIWVPPSGVMPATSRLIVARSTALRIGTAHWNELSKMSTPTVSIGRRFSITPIAARRASSIFLPSIEDDLSMMSTTQVPSGERGGASLAGSARSDRVLDGLVLDVDIALAADPQQPAALLDEMLDGSLLRGGERFDIPIIENHQLDVAQVVGRSVGSPANLKLVGFERLLQVLFGARRVLRDQQHLRAAQRDGLLEAGLAQIGGGDFPARSTAPTVLTLACTRKMIEARLDLDLARTEGLAFGGDLDGGGGAARRVQGDIDGENARR